MWQEIEYIKKEHIGSKIRRVSSWSPKPNYVVVAVHDPGGFVQLEESNHKTKSYVSTGGDIKWEVFTEAVDESEDVLTWTSYGHAISTQMWPKDTKCHKHTPVGFGSHRGYCSTCDVDLVMNNDGHWAEEE